MPRFRELLQVVLAPDAPDNLADRVLMACTRPHGGIISVPLRADEATAVAALVERAGAPFAELAEILRGQVL